MSDLEQKIKEYADAYYQGNEQISDEYYDTLIDELRKENPESKFLPENQGIVGNDLKGISKKYKLPITMGTLEKCNTDDQMRDWWNKHSHNNIITELKIDGNGCLLEFKNGVFIKAYSRGDAIYGEDRTTQINIILDREHNSTNGNVIKDFSGWIRGEIVLRRSIFNKYFKNKGYKNPRNLTAGLLGRENLSEEDKKDLSYCDFIAYDVFATDECKTNFANNIIDTEQHKLEFLKNSGYEIPEYKINPTFEELKNWKESIDTANTEIPCDGIVIKQNQVNVDDLMRITPENNVAYKPNLQTAISTIKDIKWQLKGRYFSPLAYIEPVELEGTTVVKASLANINKMNEKGVYIGAKVIVSKHGMIIPAVDSVLDPKRNAFDIPEICPRCGTKLIINESGFPECPKESCIAKVEHRFTRFFNILGIKAAGPSFIKKAAHTCQNKFDDLFLLVNNASDNNVDIFNIWAGGINGGKILKQLREYLWTSDKIKEPKSITAAQYCAMFDWPHLSVKQFEKIPDFNTTKAVRGIPFEELKQTDGIGDEIAKDMKNFFEEKHDQIEELSHYFNFEIKQDETNNNLLSICFTGACPGYTRNQLSDLCKNKYNVVDSVTKDLDILACADPNSGSSKLQKAAKNGTKVISYTELLADLV